MIYLLTFFAVLILVDMADKVEDKKIRWLLLFVSLALLSGVAGVRATSIGSDVDAYQKPLFKIAKEYTSIFDYLSNRTVRRFEIGYTLITYLASRIGDIHVLFFINEAIIVFFTFKAIWHYRQYVSVQLSTACFLFVYYLRGYDIVRQSMAMAALLYMVTLIEEKKYLNAVLIQIIAILLHKSAVVGIGMAFLYFIADSYLERVKKYLIIIISIAIYTISTNYRQIFLKLNDVFPGFLNKYLVSKKLFWASKEGFYESKFMYIFSAIFILALALVMKKHINIYKYYFFLYMMLLAMIGALIGGQGHYAYRVFLFPEAYSIFVFPNMCKLISNDGKSQFIGRVMMYAGLLFYWYFVFVLKNQGEVYPFVMG
ncbi:EpsG family protein [Butyrivibrio sp. XBB1001]|uniref:EpsG family protein n=1 Tax=Butyrivibrio sp. XBB1001 TaxID=1280682 RepID=UPI000409583C|nr:EpsG family protein [Butyrivibrio sp. XBB1001]